MLPAAVVVVVAAVAAGVALVAGDREAERPTTFTEQPPPSETDVDAVTAPRALVHALQDERTLAVTTLMGFEDALRLPVTDTEQARRSTDAAVAEFAEFVAASPDGAVYQRGLDGLPALNALRRDIDADTGPRNLDNVATALNVFDRYAGIAGGLLDDQQTYAATIEGPVLRSGAMAYGRGLRLDDQTNQLMHVSLLAVVRPGSESVADVGRLLTEVRQVLEAPVAETAGTPLAEAVTVVGEVEATGLLEAAGEAMDGTGDVNDILAVSELPADQGWPAFLDRVEETLAATS